MVHLTEAECITRIAVGRSDPPVLCSTQGWSSQTFRLQSNICSVLWQWVEAVCSLKSYFYGCRCSELSTPKLSSRLDAGMFSLFCFIEL